MNDELILQNSGDGCIKKYILCRIFEFLFKKIFIIKINSFSY